MKISEISQLTKAVLLWTGWQQAAVPRRDNSVIEREFGAKLASKLLPVIKSLEEEFYSSNARLVAKDLQEMEKIASEQFRSKHPGIADEIVHALAWCYSYDYK